MTLATRRVFTAATAITAAATALVWGTALSAHAQAPLDPDQRHQACIQAIAADPEAAFEEALVWRHQAGGWPAEHCVSLALIALGQVEDGADRLRAAAEGAISATNRSRAIMFGQAGDAYLDAQIDDKALAAFSRGIDFDPADPGLRRGRAEAAMAGADYEAAADYAGEAIAVDASDPEAHRLRGEARLAIGDITGADSDMRTARTLAPEDIDILLLRGQINEARRLGTVITLD